MHLIILKQIGSKPIRVTIAPKHWVIAALASLLVLVTGMFAGMYAAAQWGSQLPVVREIEQSRIVNEQYLQSGNTSPLDAMAIRLAEMGAQLARLDAISARLLKSNGHPPEPTKANELGRGGIRQPNEESLSYSEIQKLLEKTAKQLDKQGDVLSLIDADLQLARVKFETQPNESPLDQPVSISRFGSRIDPITGRRSVHEGIDFVAPVGTPILAAASGLVVKSGYHAAYGNMIEIEHGNGTVTRYAHASRLFAKEGQKVRLGDQIALVGSTGRSTGPHLHFEVRVNDVPKDPHQFISNNGMPRPGPATVTALNGILAESN